MTRILFIKDKMYFKTTRDEHCHNVSEYVYIVSLTYLLNSIPTLYLKWTCPNNAD